MQDLPLQAPPSGLAANWDNPAYNGKALAVVSELCLPLIMIFALLRIYTKLFVVKKTSVDDYVYILALLAGVSYIALQLSLTVGGPFGHHMWELTTASFDMVVVQAMLAVELTYGPIMWLIKTSLFLLFLKIFSPKRWLRYCVYFGISVSALFYLSTTIVTAVSCWPKGDDGNTSYLLGLLSEQCTPRNNGDRGATVSILIGIANCILNVYILVIPLPAVWSLYLPTRTKIGISAVILTGISACVCSILGVYFRFRNISLYDKTWSTTNLWLTNLLEITVGLIVPCMPMVYKLSQRFVRPVSSNPSHPFSIEERMERAERMARIRPSMYSKSEYSIGNGFMSRRTTVGTPALYAQVGRRFQGLSRLSLMAKRHTSVVEEDLESVTVVPSSTKSTTSKFTESFMHDIEKPLPALPRSSTNRSYTASAWVEEYPGFVETSQTQHIAWQDRRGFF